MLCCCNNEEGGTEIRTESMQVLNPGFCNGRGPQDEPVPEGHFNIVIQKTSGTVIGLDIMKHENVRLKIMRVKMGLVSEWNKQQTSEHACVREGDQIVAVNSQEGDCEKVLQAIAMGGELRMLILRGS
mmetsp:Transcript_31577/g.62052  ORF Transcript_31577/g.62052 Transcript_31577/m.62052 type:complete len:128 (-) Transcript_31577:199-582(-)|eukprot:CAMPEP_0172712448 /NCGR_PEP_ID=MMETSP1074-20121228/61106_1 /TAXON_ID=2916 /ORGANISM="Ceratium fusus, Strain PA161109" /LENGTH=127 /DNA_ID=CAMNT_0013536377 /DNA_START=140 /DNA_END=523 /DNA_ORIENTATION=+